MEKWHPLETLHSNIYQRNEQSWKREDRVSLKVKTEQIDINNSTKSAYVNIILLIILVQVDILTEFILPNDIYTLTIQWRYTEKSIFRKAVF